MRRSKVSEGQKKGRRRFLKTAALGAGGLALPDVSAGAEKMAPAPAEPRSVKPPSTRIEYPRVFNGPHRKMLAFPLGGIGAGSISLGGRGQLREWWIFNRPDKGNSPEYAFPSIWVQVGSQKPVTRVLEARITPPYEGPSGLGSANVPGLPRLESSTFAGAFPMATVAFDDDELPVRVTLEAFTPFIPLQADDSGLPIAVLRYRVANPQAASVRCSIAFSIANPVGDHGRSNEYRHGDGFEGLLMRNPFIPSSDPLAGTFALAVVGGGAGQVSYLRGWPSIGWWEAPLLFWDDFSDDGELGPEAPRRGPVGSLCLKREIAPHEQAEYTFLLAWHFPNRTSKRCGWSAPKDHENDVIGNHYCARLSDAWKAAEYAVANLPRLETGTRQFVDAMRESTLPGAVKDAATSTLAALVASTSFRTTDGGFHAFEGCNEHAGCCFGSCTHVWNYEAATAHLFPALSRSFRERQFGFLTDSEGRMDFRELLPGGFERWGKAAADGQMGSIMKLYLDWRLSGDTKWLRRLWPTAQRALAFAWIPGGWDANRDGVMEGVQHNTYDVEFVGPNPLCGVWYLGALRAAEEMARAVGDTSSAEESSRLFQQGSAWIDANLFNGEYYIQKVGPAPHGEIPPGLVEGIFAVDDEGRPMYQVGDGCLVDQLVGQYFAEIAGLGPLLDYDHVRKALQSIYKYNYKRSLYHHETVQRTFALNDEAALVICDYSRGRRPRVPFPYFAEVMTGFEYSAAILMLYSDMTAQGVELIENIRRRYDGERRNAWDEAECGYYYARPMAAWASVLALSGFRYHAAEKSVVAQPRIHPADFSCFWSTATGWGTFSQKLRNGTVAFSLSVAQGELACRSVALAARKAPAGSSVATLGTRPVAHQLKASSGESTFLFDPQVVVRSGMNLSLVTRA